MKHYCSPFFLLDKLPTSYSILAILILLLTSCEERSSTTSLQIKQAPEPFSQAECKHTVTARVVALEQSYVYNRFGAFNPHGLIYALRRDIVKKTPEFDEIADSTKGISEPQDQVIPEKPSVQDKALVGQVSLRSDKRPRPLVLRVNEGDCLEVTLTNLLSPKEEGQQIVTDPMTGKRDMAIEAEEPKTRSVSMHVNGLDYIPIGNQASIASDGANVGLNPSSLVEPGETKVYKWLANKEGSYLFYSMGHPVGGEGDGGQLGLGLFGSINVEPAGSKWYRSQVTEYDMKNATVGESKYKTPILNYDKLRLLDADLDKPNKTAEIQYGDLNAVIDVAKFDPKQPDLGGERCDEERKHDLSCGKPFREFTVIFHDEITAVQAYPELDEGGGMEKLKDGFAINYGASGMGSAVLARRKYDGNTGINCPECKGEEFFLSSWANGDPALLPEYKDDPSNVHHSYLGDHVRFRNLHAGPKETHVFHLHAHQWVQDKNDPQSTYLDSQTISPGASFGYEVHYGGSGNRNFTPGDSIFHCHLYPHFAQGMWELWRTHDVFENGKYDEAATVQDGVLNRNLPDYKIAQGTPNPAIVPIPNAALPPMPTEEFPGYPFYIAGEKGHRPPQPPLDFAKSDNGKELNGGLPRHLIVDGTVKDGSESVEDALKSTNWLCPNNGNHGDDLYNCGRKKSNEISNSVKQRNASEKLFTLARKIETAHIEILDDNNPRVKKEKNAMDFHAGVGVGQLKPVKLSQDSSTVSQNTSQDWSIIGYPSCDASGKMCDTEEKHVLFRVNGLEQKPGAPYADPCLPDANKEIRTRTYKAAYIQFDMTVNKHGWHDPQARIPVLEEDVKATLEGKRAPEPLFFRANSGECVQFQATNLIPSNINLDDFQAFTPTDTMGQHIHLVKFDVTSSDGSGNGWNYEDGTFSPDEVRERIMANNKWVEECKEGKHDTEQCAGVTRLTPEQHQLFTKGNLHGDFRGSCDGFEPDNSAWAQQHPWCGAQTTVQRWWADPLKSQYYRDASNQFQKCKNEATDKACVDRTLRTVFTHDHFGPSSHQQHGFYAALVIEPKGSLWQPLLANKDSSTDKKNEHYFGGELWNPNTNEYDQVLGEQRGDGGPTSYAANILVPHLHSNGKRQGECSFRHPKNCDSKQTTREFGLAFADFATVYSGKRDVGIPDIPVNPPNRKEEELPRAISFKPIPEPEAIAASDPGTQLINYRNEPIPLRVAKCSKNVDRNEKCPSYEQKQGFVGDIANVFDSRLHKVEVKADSSLIFPSHETLRLGKNEGMREEGDPATPLLPVFEGDRVQLRLIQGAQEEQHVFTMHGNKWLSQPDSPNSGWTNAQQLGISEHFEFNTTIMQDGRPTDYLYYSSATDNLWDGMWGLMRAYQKCISTSNQCISVNDLDEVFDGFDNFKYITWAHKHLAPLPTNPIAGSGEKPEQPFDPCGKNPPQNKKITITAHYSKDNHLLYNRRFKINDSDSIWFTEDDKKDSVNSSEPLIIRAAAGDCITVTLNNAIDTEYKDGIEDADSWNLMPPIVDGFNFNQLKMSAVVNLSPALLSGFVKDNEPAVGLNSIPTQSVRNVAKVLPTDNKKPLIIDTFTWYAGLNNSALSDNNKRINCTSKQIDDNCKTPVEFGVISLTDIGDVIKHSSHGGVGAAVIEPENATWDEDCGDNKKTYMQKTQAMKDICDKDHNVLFREFVLIYQDDLSLQQGGEAMPNLRLADDAEDTGQKAFNYRTEPLWARVGAGSSAVDPATMSEYDLSKVFSSQCGSNNSEELKAGEKLNCDPATPVFIAKAGTPIRFRVVHPAGHPRQHAFSLAGHHWDHSPWIKDSSKLWSPYEQKSATTTARICSDPNDPKTNPNFYGSSNWWGTEGGIGPGRHINILTCAGGDAHRPGDYMYRTQESFMFSGGLWGILRVCASDPDENGTCSKNDRT